MVAVESAGDGQSLGYRGMTVRTRQTFGVNVSRGSVPDAQRRLDPGGVASRAKRRLSRREYESAGPNAVWHIDQNDKLRQFGFETHAAIDGWSRKILWLRMEASNRLPEQILGYYIAAVQLVGYMPDVQRSDRGAEDMMVAAVQVHYHGESSHLFGRSVSNRWNQMYDGVISFWIDFFKRLETTGKYNIDDQYVYRCAIYVFADLIEATLDKVFEWWNNHVMRQSIKNPGGVPDFLYNHPELYGGKESGRRVPPMFVEHCNEAFSGCDADLENLFGLAADRPVFTVALQRCQLFPVTRDNMLDAFLYLRQVREEVHPLLSA